MNEVTVDGVSIGPTEVTTFATMLSALLVLVFHKDWGLAAHIQTIAAQALIVLPVALGVLRSFKHHLNVKVAVAHIAAQSPTPMSVTYAGTAGGTTTFVGNVASTPDPNLGVDDGPVDVDSIPEDIAP